ncbi:hypothetical protein MPER_11340 [Moniliophthora perniciosa FA553]|nr:hypothetical protein MPER_11340 [Moniliophthora perniciosa FA553]
MSSETFKLTIAPPLKPSDIPPEEVIFAAADELIESTTSWKAGKTYHKVVKTSSRPKQAGDGAPWHCRVSEHEPKDATFDQFWDKLGKNKAENEKQFIRDIQKVTQVKHISTTQEIWTLYYELTFPLSPRVFTVLQVTRLKETSPRSATIVSIPIDLSADPELEKLEQKGVKGRYVSVERLLELGNGNTEWRMAVSSSPGGLVPDCIVQQSLNSKISDASFDSIHIHIG